VDKEKLIGAMSSRGEAGRGMDWRDAKEGVGSGVLDLAAWWRWMQIENGVLSVLPGTNGYLIIYVFYYLTYGWHRWVNLRSDESVF
jgi:hypothetical protein